MSKLYHQWIGLRENLNRKPENVPITYGAFRFQFSLKINPLISAYISYHHMLRQRNPVGTEHWIPPALHPRWFNMGSIMIYSSSAICLNIARFFKNRINLLVLSREWMGCWGLLGLLLLVIMDHSRKFPTFSTSKSSKFWRRLEPSVDTEDSMDHTLRPSDFGTCRCDFFGGKPFNLQGAQSGRDLPPCGAPNPVTLFLCRNARPSILRVSVGFSVERCCLRCPYQLRLTLT